jgi:hypothetical protein
MKGTKRFSDTEIKRFTRAAGRVANGMVIFENAIESETRSTEIEDELETRGQLYELAVSCLQVAGDFNPSLVEAEDQTKTLRHLNHLLARIRKEQEIAHE